MNARSLLSVSFTLFSIAINFCQNTYDIVLSSDDFDRDQKCQQCYLAFDKKPKEVKFSIKRQKTNLYFEVNDKNWFNLLFKNPDDGLAVEIVLKDRYKCQLETIEKNQFRGLLLKPIYAQELKTGLKANGENIYSVYVGKVPNNYLNDELEYNILFLGNKNLCRYNVIYDLESYIWDLLDMGVYLDSLAYNSKQIKSSDSKNYVIRNKSLKFKIPFKKNKSNYSLKDIKPIYDSLRLTDFNIKAINIKVYASIEGIESRNKELQILRANSIVAALQAFQKPTIKTEVSSSENWVEFFNDIQGTKYDYLSSLSKNDVRDKIAGVVSKEMEPILKNHRKAVIELELEKKDKFKEESADMLLAKFNSDIDNGNLNEAKEVQNSIFERIKEKRMPKNFLSKMVVPKQAKFAKILNKNSAFKYMLDFREALIVYDELLELEKLAPTDKEIKYNIAAIKIKLWSFNAIDVDETKLKNQIYALKSYGVDSSLISRMVVNFHIIKAENLMAKRDYTNKDKSVAYIKSNYKKLTLSEHDYLSLAQFFSYYANTNMAVELLEKKARSIDIDEDLLFYYLNLTLVKKEFTQDLNYRTILLNAYNMNEKRFCKLFNSVENGGVTFQLLEDEYLRRTYCESCNN